MSSFSERHPHLAKAFAPPSKIIFACPINSIRVAPEEEERSAKLKAFMDDSPAASHHKGPGAAGPVNLVTGQANHIGGINPINGAVITSIH